MSCNSCNSGSSSSHVNMIANGVVGLTKYALGIDSVDSPTLYKRREICNACHFQTNGITCNICSCIITAKTALAGEKCPQGFW